ncbi:MAG: nicotinate-nucleotide--dimethylbenzimidazole phosphoribosyltransferase [Actinomycetia bacterium]|nr:nicotinate-nucleotide--dimethylbenzimidazole phosphoribosyltransferase [Actinomycetes bacterium]
MYSKEEINENIRTLQPRFFTEAQQKLDSLTKPKGSLGRLEAVAMQIAAITQNLSPALEHKYIVTMAADHGVVEEGVSAYPQQVTTQMVYNILSGGAAINVLAEHIGARVCVVDIGVNHDFKSHTGLYNKKIAPGTANMTKGPAMSLQQALAAVNTGIEIVKDLAREGCQIIGTGEMGIGNTTASSAVAAVICGAKVDTVTGSGTGIDRRGIKKKKEVIEKALRVNKPVAGDGLDVLAKVGGLEIGGIAGLILGAAMVGIPVVVDGFISTAGALIAHAIAPRCKSYMLASHRSAEAGHTLMLDYLGLKPMFDFDMRLGEGTGAALGINIAEAAVKIMNQMATFDSAGVSKSK